VVSAKKTISISEESKRICIYANNRSRPPTKRRRELNVPASLKGMKYLNLYYDVLFLTCLSLVESAASGTLRDINCLQFTDVSDVLSVP
jgi:hypothetical protein